MKTRSHPRDIQPMPSQLSALLGEVAARRRLSRAEILSPHEHPYIVEARDEVWALAQEANARIYSAAQLGRLFGRNHSTVLRGVRRHRSRRSVS